jgi:NADPH-dependent 2,4-dienoyl-CoA reductase/sulfur reductase-like enzyme
VGIRPNVELAKSAGIQLGRSGAIQVDARMRTNLRSVFAAGDCAESVCRVINKTTWIPLGSTANKQGRVAGDNASGVHSKFNGITSTSVVKVFNTEVATTGLSSKIAKKLGFPFSSVLISAGTRAHYYPDSKSIHVKLIFNNQNGRLLGAQMVGAEGAAKRIDILATALYNKMTVGQLAELDLSYSPPFAPAWDPVLVAANQAIKKVRN